MISGDTPDAPAVPPETIPVVSDAGSGLGGVIVLHSTRRGPAAGGCRLWRYADRAALTADALRLAEGMAYKNALADLPLGGGKAVLNPPDGSFDRRRLFAAFGRSEEHTSELQSLMRISYAVFCLKKTNNGENNRGTVM